MQTVINKNRDMKNIIINPEVLQKIAEGNRVAFIYHLRIGD